MGCDVSRMKGGKEEREFLHLGEILQSAHGSAGIGNIAKMTLVMGRSPAGEKGSVELVEPQLHDLDSEERRLLKVTLCGVVLEQCPDFYQRIWIQSIDKAPNIVEIISPTPGYSPKSPLGINTDFLSPEDVKIDCSAPSRSAAVTFDVDSKASTHYGSMENQNTCTDPEVDSVVFRRLKIDDPCIVKMSRKIDSFFEKLLYEYNFNAEYAEEACYDLGQLHHNYNYDRGLRPLHFDIFFHSLLNILEEIDFGDDYHKETAIRAWKKLAKYIIYHMSQGYQHKKNFSNATRDLKIKT